MGTVIAFPTKSMASRSSTETAIREGLSDEGLPTRAIEIVIANMSEFIEALHLEFTFSCSAGDVVAIREQMQEFQNLLNSRTNSLIRERVKTEVISLRNSGVI
jgi:hypothetical protein